MNRNLKRLIRKKGRRFKSGMDKDRARYLDNMITDSLSKAEILNSQFKFVFTPQFSGTQCPKIKPLHISENCVFMLPD